MSPAALGERVGYQGEPGAFSEEAVRALFPDPRPVPHRTFRSIFEDVAAGRIRYGLVPLENSQAGSINETYDLLSRGGVWIVGEVRLQVDHALLALPGTRLEDVRRVSSHPQALAQCQDFLVGLGVDLVPVYDTAGAAKAIAQEGRSEEAAVAAPRAGEIYGLDVLARRIQSHADNQTRFAAIAADPAPLGPADKTSILFQVRNEPGALYRCLGAFADGALNLSKLESRPIAHEPWQYRFYLDVDAGMQEEAMQRAVRHMDAFVTLIRVLGSYAGWRAAPAASLADGPPAGSRSVAR